MKSQLLPRIWFKTKCALYGFVLPCFLCCTLWANSKNSPRSHEGDTRVHNELENYNLQDIVITGKITDETGMGLPGATVQEKGANNSVVTDLDGSFKIKVKGESSILVISYVGF